MKITKRQAVLVLGAYAAGMIGAAVIGGPAQAVESENCKTVTQNMVRPDSGVGGHEWATDTYKRVVKVCVVQPEAKALIAVTSATFKVVGHDEGTFVTKGVKSPKGNAMLPGVQGTFTGDFEATYTAPYDPQNPTVWPFWAPSGSNGDSTTPWVAKLWSAGSNAKGELTKWAWTYRSCNEEWKNAIGGNPGDITGLSSHDLAKKCLLVTYKVQCDGKVNVTIDNKLVAGIKVKLNGVEKTLVLGVNTFTGVTTTDGWIRIDHNGRRIYEARCIKPTTCPTPTATATPTATPTVVPTTPVATVTPSTTTAVPVAGVGDNGSLAVTGTSGGNPVPWLVGGGVTLVAIGAALMFLVWRNRQTEELAVEGDGGNDTLTFTRIP